MSPPAAGTLLCGWNTGVPLSLRRVFTRAEAMPNTDTSTVFYLGRSIIEIQARPVVVVLQVSIHVHCLMLSSVSLAININYARFRVLTAVLLEPEKGTAAIPRNMGKTLADNTELHSRRYESSAVI